MKLQFTNANVNEVHNNAKQFRKKTATKVVAARTLRRCCSKNAAKPVSGAREKNERTSRGDRGQAHGHLRIITDSVMFS